MSRSARSADPDLSPKRRDPSNTALLWKDKTYVSVEGKLSLNFVVKQRFELSELSECVEVQFFSVRFIVVDGESCMHVIGTLK